MFYTQSPAKLLAFSAHFSSMFRVNEPYQTVRKLFLRSFHLLTNSNYLLSIQRRDHNILILHTPTTSHTSQVSSFYAETTITSQETATLHLRKLPPIFPQKPVENFNVNTKSGFWILLCLLILNQSTLLETRNWNRVLQVTCILMSVSLLLLTALNWN